MGFQSKTFDVGLDSEASMITFGARVAMADYVRSYFRKKIEGAEDAGVDRMTAMQRASLDWGKAARGSRMVRSIPASLVQWAGYAEYNTNFPWFIRPLNGSIGTFDKGALVGMPGNVKMIQLGGLTFVGLLDMAIPSDLYEVRVTKFPDLVQATILWGRPDNDSRLEVPEPVEPEGVDA